MSLSTSKNEVMGDRVTVKGAARLLHYHPHHVYRLLANGRLKGQKFGHMWTISRDEVQRLQGLQNSFGYLPRRDRLVQADA